MVDCPGAIFPGARAIARKTGILWLFLCYRVMRSRSARNGEDDEDDPPFEYHAAARHTGVKCTDMVGALRA